MRQYRRQDNQELVHNSHGDFYLNENPSLIVCPCAAECPARAIDLMHFRGSQLEAKVGALISAQVS